MRVLKFGGSSVKDADRIRNVGNILKGYSDQGIKYTVVFSAMGGITDLLISMATKASKGNEDYKSDVDVFIQRHNDVIESLFDQHSLYDDVVKTIEEQHDTLKNLLYGIYLVREASPYYGLCA